MSLGLAQLLGHIGEAMAEEYFKDQLGATVLARNYKSGSGEADLIVLHNDELVAVEVKTRTVEDLVAPEEAVTWWQLKRIVHALATYAVEADLAELHWRVDLVAIETRPDGTVLRLDHLPDIFPP
jgi:putative endonuclease